MTALKVTKSNELITSKFSFSLNEYRIILYGVSLINPVRPEFPQEYKIDVKRFCQLFNIPATNIYQDIKSAILDKLFNRRITIDSDKLPEGRKRFPLLDSVDYSDKSTEIIIQFHRNAIPFLHQLKEHFTSYYLGQVAHFKSAYSIRFYEWCVMRIKQNEGKPTQFFLTVQEIKERLEITGKYELYSNFKRRVFLKAFEEINVFSDLSVRHEEIKKGRSVDQLKIIVKYKKWEKKEKQYTINFDPKLKV